MNRRHLSLGTGLTLLVVAACDRAPEPSATTTVRDSGGVAIVEVAAMPSLPEWRVSEPVIAVGGVDDRPEYELYNAHHARRAAEREELDMLPAARTLPAFSDLFVDRLGRIWVMEFTRETEGPGSWTVHGADGIPAARLTMDRGMAPRDAEDAHLLAWSRDDLDVERITLHRIFTGDGS